MPMGSIDLDGNSTPSWRDGDPALVCLMLANNETGTTPANHSGVRPLPSLMGRLLHVDAVPAAGRMAQST